MINKLKYATISDIGVRDLIFYDVSNKEHLIDFCRKNGISYLPTRDRKGIYKLYNNDFVKDELSADLSVNSFDMLFADQTLEKFEKINSNEIRFILDNGKIRGVVHIIDYNNEFLYVELYRAILRFENNLRTVLIRYGFDNRDFIDWIYGQSINQKRESKREFWAKRYLELIPDDLDKLNKTELIRRDANPFQTFYLKELLLYFVSKRIVNGNDIAIEELCNLRNLIMHSKDVTTYLVGLNGTVIYNFEGLKTFVNNCKKFFLSYEVLEDLIS
ncbi:hypothetical protein AAKU52_001189 [Pedobacter sp. CG_S7]|uniref:hypothetical protein n=1 Tax=Pedobacter sp. CG_S7 TaxID=3143930 RepID=UPI003393E26F